MALLGPSKHLSWKELACKDGTSYPLEWRNNRAISLSEVFELIRVKCGNKPIIVLSGYRTIEWNKKIGGARRSQHIQGKALDLRPPSHISIREFYNSIRSLADIHSFALKGLGRYKTFVHIDIRSSNRLVVWRGSGLKDDRKIV